MDTCKKEVVVTDAMLDAAYAQYAGHRCDTERLAKSLAAKIYKAMTLVREDELEKEGRPEPAVNTWGDVRLDCLIDGACAMKIEITDEMVERAAEFLSIHRSSAVYPRDQLAALLQTALNGFQRRFTDTPQTDRREDEAGAEFIKFLGRTVHWRKGEYRPFAVLRAHRRKDDPT